VPQRIQGGILIAGQDTKLDAVIPTDPRTST